jgi:hypothetical protein
VLLCTPIRRKVVTRIGCRVRGAGAGVADRRGPTEHELDLGLVAGGCPFQVIAMARENMARLSHWLDFTVIDGPPHAEGITRSCIIASDIVVVPIELAGRRAGPLS